MERENELLCSLSSPSLGSALNSDGMFMDEMEESAARLPEVQKQLGSPLWLRLCGILPWEFAGAATWLYWGATVLLGAGAVAVCAERLAGAQAAATESAACEIGICLQFAECSDLTLAVGGLLGTLVSLMLAKAKLLGSCDAVLVTYARRQGVAPRWAEAARRRSALLAALWVGSVALRCAALWPFSLWRDLLPAAAFAVASALFTGVTYGILHVGCAITMMVDAYCVHLPGHPDLRDSVHEWNVLEVVLRKVSRNVEKAFLVVQTTALIMLLLGTSALFLLGVSEIWSLLSTVFLTLSAALIFHTAADVTEKCTRMPSLINSLTFRNEVDPARHFLVEYVTYSAAGFYVGQVRLTAAMALKFTYISGLAAFGVLTKATASQ